MKKYKAIISDVDGTLTPLALHSVPSAKIKKAIAALNKRNFPFSIATGKPFFLIEHLIAELGLRSPLIVDNGAAIFDPISKKSLWLSVMSDEKVKTVVKIAKNYNKVIRLSASSKAYIVGKQRIPSSAQIVKVRVAALTKKETEEFTQQIEKVLKDVALVKTSAYEGNDFFNVYVTNAEATKQYAILKFAEILGVSTKEIIGIGDHYNDFPLLMACGLRVAMGNAVEDLKAIADYIAPSVDEDGVADVIKKFL